MMRLSKKKSISKENMNEIFNKHIEISNDSVKKAKEKIEDIYSDNYGKKLDMLVALTSVVKKIDLSKELKRIEKDIIKFINDNNNVLKNKLNIVIDTLYENYREKFSIEYSDDEVRSFLILILMKREEEMYE